MPGRWRRAPGYKDQVGHSMAFLAELKRRRVGKVAIAYGAVAWAATESASVVLPALHVPDWAMTLIVVFLLVGFPVAMVLAWVFDVDRTGHPAH